MAEVICDTSALQYLHQLDLLHLLPAFAGSVIVPQAVADELLVGRAIGMNVPDPYGLTWATVRAPNNASVLASAELGRGETQVIELALELPGAIAILDDNVARQVAKSLGIPFRGIVGILLDSKRDGTIPSIAPLLDQLQALGFYLSNHVRLAVLGLAGEIS